jgi:hypothetical protein
MKRSESFSPSLFTLWSEFIAICRASYHISMTAAVCLGQLSLTLRRVRLTGPRRFMSALAQEDDALQRGANQFECRKPTREDPFWHEAIVSKMDPGLAKKKLLGNVAFSLKSNSNIGRCLASECQFYRIRSWISGWWMNCHGFLV